jgi:DNA-binding IclR family transcriptional regulator
VLLAWEPANEVEKILRSDTFEPLSRERGLGTVGFHRRLSVIRSQGYACSRGELDSNVLGISAPVRDHTGDVVAAVGVVCLAGRVSRDRLIGLVRDVVEAGGQISYQLAVAGEKGD